MGLTLLYAFSVINHSMVGALMMTRGMSTYLTHLLVTMPNYGRRNRSFRQLKSKKSSLFLLQRARQLLIGAGVVNLPIKVRCRAKKLLLASATVSEAMIYFLL